MRKRRKGIKYKKQMTSIGGIIAVILAAIMLILNYDFDKDKKPSEDDDSILFVSVIDVGQGDSILLSLGEYDILIDAGDGDAGEAVTGYLSRMEADDIDLLVATHPHYDHIGGMPDVFEKYSVKKVLIPEIDDDSAPSTAIYERFIDCLSASQANADGEIYYAQPGDTYSFGELVLTVISPYSCSDDYNNDSVVLRAQFGETSFLFTGDAEEKAEKIILKNQYAVSADVLKVGHHGSSSSTSESFLAAVNPEYAVISCGRDNSYGHPHAETLEMLREYGVNVLRTDLDGTVIFTSDGKEVTSHK